MPIVDNLWVHAKHQPFVTKSKSYSGRVHLVKFMTSGNTTYYEIQIEDGGPVAYERYSLIDMINAGYFIPVDRECEPYPMDKISILSPYDLHQKGYAWIERDESGRRYRIVPYDGMPQLVNAESLVMRHLADRISPVRVRVTDIMDDFADTARGLAEDARERFDTAKSSFSGIDFCNPWPEDKIQFMPEALTAKGYTKVEKDVTPGKYILYLKGNKRNYSASMLVALKLAQKADAKPAVKEEEKPKAPVVEAPVSSPKPEEVKTTPVMDEITEMEAPAPLESPVAPVKPEEPDKLPEFTPIPNTETSFTMYQMDKQYGPSPVDKHQEDAWPYLDNELMIVADGLGGTGDSPVDLSRIHSHKDLYKAVLPEDEKEEYLNYFMIQFNDFLSDTKVIRTQAYFGSRISVVRYLYALKTGITAENEIYQFIRKGFKHFIETYRLTTAKRYLPTTLVSIRYYDETEDSITADVDLAGDSRALIFDASGLRPISKDQDIKGDAMWNLLTGDAEEGKIIRKTYTFKKPCCLICVSDGIFDNFPNNLEYPFISRLAVANTLDDYYKSLCELYKQYKGRKQPWKPDDCTIAFKMFGYKDFTELKDTARTRILSIKPVFEAYARNAEALRIKRDITEEDMEAFRESILSDASRIASEYADILLKGNVDEGLQMIYDSAKALMESEKEKLIRKQKEAKESYVSRILDAISRKEEPVLFDSVFDLRKSIFTDIQRDAGTDLSVTKIDKEYQNYKDFLNLQTEICRKKEEHDANEEKYQEYSSKLLTMLEELSSAYNQLNTSHKVSISKEDKEISSYQRLDFSRDEKDALDSMKGSLSDEMRDLSIKLSEEEKYLGNENRLKRLEELKEAKDIYLEKYKKYLSILMESSSKAELFTALRVKDGYMDISCDIDKTSLSGLIEDEIRKSYADIADHILDTYGTEDSILNNYVNPNTVHTLSIYKKMKTDPEFESQVEDAMKKFMDYQKDLEFYISEEEAK